MFHRFKNLKQKDIKMRKYKTEINYLFYYKIKTLQYDNQLKISLYMVNLYIFIHFYILLICGEGISLSGSDVMLMLKLRHYLKDNTLGSGTET